MQIAGLLLTLPTVTILDLGRAPFTTIVTCVRPCASDDPRVMIEGTLLRSM